MLLKMPLYCKEFKCIANKCKDNCCIGWEIDIDPSSAEYYKSVKGDFGEKLRENIIEDEVCSFRLRNERCAFLNDCNLCEIIINLGEDKLCQICSDHPRYFEWFSDVKEGGIGLCCEEAARIIVTNEDSFGTFEVPCDDEGCDDCSAELYDVLSFARQEIIAVLENREISLKTAVASVLDYVCELQFRIDNYNFDKLPLNVRQPDGEAKADVKGFLSSFRELEPIDDSWQEYLKKLIDSREALSKIEFEDKNTDRYLRNVAVYFIWRYFLKGVYDEEIISKIFLMAVSVAMIKQMYRFAVFSGAPADAENCSMLAKSYSKEVEYSQENLEKICDMVYDNPAFSKENITALI